MFKIFYSDKEVLGETREDWDNAPQRDVQLLLVSCDPTLVNKTRVGWFNDRPGWYGEVAYYWWGEADDKPSGITPDTILDKWAELTGKTDVTIADLSLDDLQSIGVKLGRSIDTPDFRVIVKRASEDKDIR